MIDFAVIATGPSMSQKLADAIPVHCIVVNDAYKLRPDADALVANDRAWWNVHKSAHAFAGRKFSTNPPERSRVEKIDKTTTIQTSTNSALLALHVAITHFGATRVLLYGVDMSDANGAHYFGQHKGLPNTAPGRFDLFKKQFAAYVLPKHVRVWNATPGSALQCYPFLT